MSYSMREKQLEKRVEELETREKKLIKCAEFYADNELYCYSGKLAMKPVFNRLRDRDIEAIDCTELDMPIYLGGKLARQTLAELNKPKEENGIKVSKDCGA